ncbi:uncharacterized protein MYCFIDRAFT_76322 [Pseudocercospora fijiensis CIRAD86]|uniref:Uncharacterized protein n=1 Tax=Pseudocercospora fijiensis (strain CIRAD86) TaxID=383855 RepID=N1Q802_PSEFD|nr:uncharacterized protein MYCFIDRAFT_76322 [Pseudocercospora fijiensis CIRAD86]EME88940.1 hypothetical protein MYCFIDRAFT_76322 [Pseudocercospora fijiensis CIRAD86]
MEQELANVLTLDPEMTLQADVDHLNCKSTTRERPSPSSDPNNPSSLAATNANDLDIDLNHQDDSVKTYDPASIGILGTPDLALLTAHYDDTTPCQKSEEKVRDNSVVGQDDIHCESSFSVESSNFSGATNPELLADAGFEEFGVSQRQLRPQCRQKGFTTTWLDTDTTGDYNPIEDERMNRLKRSRASGRSRNQARCGNDTTSSHSASSGVESSRGVQEAVSLPVTLNFRSESGRRLFARKVEAFESQLHSDQLAQADARAVVEAPTDHPSPQEPGGQASGSNVGAGGTLCTIRTSFSHPIMFNCDDDSQSTDMTPPNGNELSCHFCTEPSLPFFGLGQIETQVIDHPEDPGFVEMGDGYRSRGIENTRLCGVCTLRRMCVIVCDKHTMRPSTDLAAFSPASQEAAEEKLLEGDLTPDDAERFCSVCTRLATHECVSETGEDTPGCGLRLCKNCAITLEARHDGNLKGMLESSSVRDTAEEQSLVRADCELLREDGALFKYMRHPQ